MYLGLGKSIIQFVVPPPGHGPLDILSGRQSEHFKIKWGQAYVVGIICPLIGIGLIYLPKSNEEKYPLSPYVPPGLKLQFSY